MPIRSFITADKEGFLTYLDGLISEHNDLARDSRSLINRAKEFGIASGLGIARRAVENWENLSELITNGDQHDYKPDFTKTGDPCEICGFGRHHPWHEAS